MASRRDTDDTHVQDDTRAQLVELVRRALIDCAARAHEDAGLRGLCCEGAWEATVSAMRQLDLQPLLTPPGVPGAAHGTAR
jgi:hypothetical protein